MYARIGTACLALLLTLSVPAPSAAPPGGPAEEFDIGPDAAPLFVPVTVGGKAHLFLVDTGCTSSVFDVSLLPLLGEVKDWRTVLTPAGPARFGFAAPPAAFVGRLPFPANGTVLVHDLARLRETSGLEIMGCLGMDFLSNYAVRIDFDRGRLTLSRSPGPATGRHLPMTTRSGRAGVDLEVTEGGPAEWFLIDTGDVGFDSKRLGEDLFRRLRDLGRLTPAGRSKAQTTGEGMEVSQGRLGLLKVGPFRHEGLYFGTARDGNALGLGFWARYAVTFDFPAGVVHLKPGLRHAAPDTPGGSGLAFLKRDGRMVVEGVREGSPAAGAGIRKGDELVSIDDRKAARGSVFTLGRLLCGSGRTVCVVIRRGEEVRELEIRLDTSWRTAGAGR